MTFKFNCKGDLPITATSYLQIGFRSRGNRQLSPRPDASDHPMPKKRPPLESARGPENVVQNPLLVGFCTRLTVLGFLV
jgi:hypothetical protein